MPAVRDRPTVCRLHRFDGQKLVAVAGIRICAEGHEHLVDLKLYHCTGCGFPLTMALEP